MNLFNNNPYHFSSMMLQLLGIFRLVVAVILSAIYFISQKLWPLDENISHHFQLLLLSYLGFLLLSTLLLKRRPFQNDATIRIFSVIDLAMLSFLCFLTDGLDSPLIIMILISLMAHGAFLPIYQGIILVGIAIIVQLYFWVEFYDPKYYYSIQEYISDPYIIKIFSQGLFTLFAVFLSNRWLRITHKANLKVEEKDRELKNIALLHEAVIQQLNNGIIVLDEHARIILSNQYVTAWFQEEVILNSALEVHFPELFKRYTLWKSLNFQDRSPFSYKEDLFYIDFIPIHSPELEYTLIDIEQVDVVNQRAQQNKLAALGQLTAAIAHEIRNPMTSISQAAQLLSERNELDTTDERMLTMITNNINRANNIINRVLSLAKRDTPRFELIPLAPLLEEIKIEFEVTYPGYKDQLHFHIAPELTTLYFDRSHLIQIINNLINNAITHTSQSKEQLVIYIYGALVSGNPALALLDNGDPISKEKREHLFEPFFTTNKRGTGLGLFVVREICEINHAHIDYITDVTLNPNEQLHGFRIIFSNPF